MSEHGSYLNTPELQTPCPRCASRECRMSVYTKALVWQCGHAKALPPLHRGPGELRNCRVCHG